MRKYVILTMVAALAPAAFAVDGVVLINQATVLAAGGFPYIINQPGSYRLSGNLTMNSTPAGNYLGLFDTAIGIAAKGVTLDLNGFSITVTSVDPNTRPVYAITDLGLSGHASIRNGLIFMRIRSSTHRATGISLLNSPFSIIEDIRIHLPPYDFIGTAFYAIAIRIAHGSIVRRNVFTGGLDCLVGTASVVIENSFAIVQSPNCKYINNNDFLPSLPPDFYGF